MRVMKFGGSSLASPERLQTILTLIERAVEKERVVVVTSALEGVTDQLTGMVAPGGEPIRDVIRTLVDRHIELREQVAWRGARELNAAPGKAPIDIEEFKEGLHTILDELKYIEPGGSRPGTWTPAARDWALGIGERASAFLISSLLEASGIRARPVDGADVIRTDSSFGSATPLVQGTERLARWTLGQFPPEVVPVVGGFSGSDGNGRRTTLGRGSSDLTATLIASALSAGTVEIWTDVDGVFDRDPARHPDALLFPRLSYGEARKLAREGATVLHPDTLDPIEPHSIHLRVRNTSRPHAPGTLVSPPSLVSSGTGEGKRVNLLLAGATGGVGRTVLQHLHHLRDSLRGDGVEIRVGGAFSSRAQLWESDEVDLPRIPSALIPGSPTNWEEISHRVRSRPPENPVLIDCTASPEVSRIYAELLRSGIPVVTPNKLAASGPLADYQDIKRAALENKMPYRYETTVGAALPILKTVRELRRSGDRFRKIEGVLSGTLSFVFAKLTEGALFSEAVREARDKGFTEPHPMEDLGGMDVARKLLILLREAGYDLEPESIPVESLVPESLKTIEDPEEFLDGLVEFDEEWATRLKQVERGNLGYVAWFQGGKAGVGVREIPEGHPLFALRPTENRLVLTSDLYPEVPLTIAGPGAGREVTASGVVSDLLEAIQERYGGRRVA